MLIYGTKTPLRKTELIFEPCPNCKRVNSIEIHIFQKYLHLFWIPLVPLSKTGWARCVHCHEVFTIFQMPPSILSGYERIRKNTITQVWTFTGLLLCIIGPIALGISDNRKHEKVSTLINSPRKNDVLEIMLDYNKYILYKVIKVEKDSVYFCTSKYEATDQRALSDLENKGDTIYETSMIQAMPIKRLIEMNKDDKIVDINRK